MGVLRFGATGGIVVLGVGLYAASGLFSRVAFNDAVERFDLKPAQVEVMRACKASMSKYRRKFKGGASKVQGCACLAHKLTSVIDSHYYEAAERVISVFMRASRTHKGKAVLVAAYTQDPILRNVTESTRLVMFKTVARSLPFCGDRATYRDDDARAS